MWASFEITFLGNNNFCGINFLGDNIFERIKYITDPHLWRSNLFFGEFIIFGIFLRNLCVIFALYFLFLRSLYAILSYIIFLTANADRRP